MPQSRPLIEKTSRKYFGRVAETYEQDRKPQIRWKKENRIVRTMLTKLKPRSVLDTPIGTGRYLPLYKELGVKEILGVDISSEMIHLAKKKVWTGAHIRLITKDVRRLSTATTNDVAVCVRFLDLIDEAALYEVMDVLTQRTRRAIVCTIRFGKVYVCKVNTATHDEAKFRRWLDAHDWRIARAVPIFTQGWHVLLLKRR